MAQGGSGRVCENIFIHMSSRVLLFVVSPPTDLFLSFECLYILPNLFTSLILLILHVVGTAEYKNPAQEYGPVAMQSPRTNPGWKPGQVVNRGSQSSQANCVKEDEESLWKRGDRNCP